MSYTLFLYGGKDQIGKTIDDIVMTYMPEGGRIFDATCGPKQYQLRQLRKGKLDVQYEIITADLRPVGNIQCSVFHVPLQDQSAGITIYDPPFIPQSKEEVRVVDYGIHVKNDLDDIRRFYSADVLRELMRVTGKYLLVRGSDFYWPRTSSTVHYFWDLCIAQARAIGMEPLALHINPVRHRRMPWYRARLRHLERPLVNHSYIAVFPKIQEVASCQ